MALIQTKENIIMITSDEGQVLVLQKQGIIGFHLISEPHTLPIILTNVIVPIRINVLEGWSDVLEILKNIVSVNSGGNL